MCMPASPTAPCWPRRASSTWRETEARENLGATCIKGLRDRGHDVDTVSDEGMGGAFDADVLAAAAGLIERLGLRFELSGDGTGDIVGVPAEVRARFSKRRAAIDEHMRKKGTSGPRAAEVATLSTRQAKDHSFSE